MKLILFFPYVFLLCLGCVTDEREIGQTLPVSPSLQAQNSQLSGNKKPIADIIDQLRTMYPNHSSKLIEGIVRHAHAMNANGDVYLSEDEIDLYIHKNPSGSKRMLAHVILDVYKHTAPIADATPAH